MILFMAVYFPKLTAMNANPILCATSMIMIKTLNRKEQKRIGSTKFYDPILLFII